MCAKLIRDPLKFVGEWYDATCVSCFVRVFDVCYVFSCVKTHMSECFRARNVLDYGTLVCLACLNLGVLLMIYIHRVFL